MQGIKARILVALITSVFLAGLTGSAAAEQSAELATSTPVFMDIATSGRHTCAVKTDGTVWCWGRNIYGPLSMQSYVAHMVPNINDATSVTTGWEHTCVLRDEGNVWCWGLNGAGELGIGSADLNVHATPSRVVDASGNPLSEITSLQTGPTRAHTCAVRADYTVWCWGDNLHGQLGVGTEVNHAYATQVASAGGQALTGVSSVSAGELHTCAKKIDSTVWCWGTNQYGQLGIGVTSLKRTTPVQVYDATAYPFDGAVRVSSGYFSTCAITSNATSWCWGFNSRGQLGNGNTQTEPVPVAVQGLPLAGAIASGDIHTCAVDLQNAVWCWGYNHRGQLGTPGTLQRIAPGKAGVEFGGVTKISAARDTTCTIKNDGSAWCWGSNSNGQLGNNSGASWTASPVKVLSYQSITLPIISNRSLAQPLTFSLAPTASSNLPVELQATGSCGVTGYEVTVVSFGTCRIAATQPGNGDYIAADEIARSFEVSRAPQTISFSTLVNRDVIAAPFSASVNSSSGLPVTLHSVDTSVCTASDIAITVLDVGTCVIRAAQAGNETYAPAATVERSFNVTRVLLSNKKVTFLDSEGRAVVGLNVTWATPDGRYRSTTSTMTDLTGSVTYVSLPAGVVTFTYGGMRGNWISYGNLSASVRVTTAPVNLAVQTGELTEELTVQVQLTDGTVVPGASVALSRQFNTGFLVGDLCAGVSWRLLSCSNSAKTTIDGTARFLVVKRSDGYRNFATVTFADGDITQTSERVEIVSGMATVILDQLPVVDLLADDSVVPYASRQTMTAVALDSLGDPIAGQRLTISANVSGAATTSSCRSTLTATTNSLGRATFVFCPIKTATWTADGLSILGSRGVRIGVQLVPTTPRTVVATRGSKSVSLTWKAPALVNAGRVTDYVIQYRRAGTETWTTFKDGISTSLKATVTKLAAGRSYEFRIAAKNSAGTSAWSSSVWGTPR